MFKSRKLRRLALLSRWTPSMCILSTGTWADMDEGIYKRERKDSELKITEHLAIDTELPDWWPQDPASKVFLKGKLIFHLLE